MAGWETTEEAWAEAEALAESKNASTEQLLGAGRIYMDDHWQDADRFDVQQLVEAVVCADRLELLPKYLEEVMKK